MDDYRQRPRQKIAFPRATIKLDSARTVLLILLASFWTKFEAYRERIAEILAWADRLRLFDVFDACIAVQAKWW